ncbi:MAG: anthranilate synthase component I [Gammaproteobacteria bacterium]
MTREQFQSYADQGYNAIPVVREVLADLDTPLSAYLKLAFGPHTYLLESVEGGEKWGRYSIIGLAAKSVFKVTGRKVVIESGGKVESEIETDDPFSEIQRFQSRFRVPDMEGLPRFSGGLVGYFGYDCVAYIEPHLKNHDKEDVLGCPDIYLMVSDRIAVFDNVSGKILLIVHADPAEDDAYDRAVTELETLATTLTGTSVPTLPAVPAQDILETDFQSGFTQDGFMDGVRRIKEYILEGDVMQVVLSQRMSIPFKAPPLNLYRALRCTNPSPYMYYLHLGDFHVVGASPEILVRLEDGIVTVRPIAGTRPRGKTEDEDRALEEELLADPKECAEHLMLIDLGRNDVGRIARTGSVNLTDKMVIERYSHVMHIVSNVTGEMAEGHSALDVLAATFPAGTLSGAPKIRAMEIINELEPSRRGVYGGAVGYLSWDGNMDTAIAIRTAVIKDDTLYIQAGGGIVADSVPENEWDETMNKGRAIFRAVSMAVNDI